MPLVSPACDSSGYQHAVVGPYHGSVGQFDACPDDRPHVLGGQLSLGGREMATDLTVSLLNQPGTLLRASDALGRAGVNIQGACGYLCDGHGTFHVLVEDAEGARRAR